MRQPLNSNGGEGWKRCGPGEDERRGVVDRGARGGRRHRLQEHAPQKHGSRCRTREVEGRLERRWRHSEKLIFLMVAHPFSAATRAGEGRRSCLNETHFHDSELFFFPPLPVSK